MADDNGASLWVLWLQMADDSLRAARLFQSEYLRSCSSRLYYAAFQATTALLHYRGGLTPPTVDGEQWEHWGHDKTPDIVVDHLSSSLTRNERFLLRKSLRELYKNRLYADYSGSDAPTAEDIRALYKVSANVVRIVRQVIAEGRTTDHA